METRQAIFREEYCDTLRNNLNFGTSVPNYIAEEPSFNYSDKDLCYLTDFRVDHERLKEMCTGNHTNLECAILLYEAFPDMTPMLASYEPLWLYFAHSELFTYLRKRWNEFPKKKDGAEEEPLYEQANYISKYWFYHGPMKTWLASLWWSVYLTIDESKTEKYELTEILFRQEDIRTRTFGTYPIFRHKPAAIAILTFIKNHLDDIFNQHFQNRCREMAKIVNFLGGCRQLSYMDEQFFLDVLESKKDVIASK